VQAPQPGVEELLSEGHVAGILAEAGGKLAAARVRLRRHLAERFPDPQARPRRQIRRRKVQLDDQIIAEERQRLPVGEQPGHIGAHNRELRLGIRRRPLRPAIALEAALRRHRGALGQASRIRLRTGDDEHHGSRVGWRRGERSQPLIEEVVREVHVGFQRRSPGRRERRQR